MVAPRVLIVDDEPNILLPLEFLMRREGYEVRSARDGEEGWQAVQQWRPDLVLLDVMMPQRDGFEVCGLIRSDPALAAADQFWIDRIVESGRMYGLPDARPFTPDRWLEDGDTVSLGQTTWEVRHCPGHTPGHVIFFNRAARFAQVGDVLFQGSVGRTDFPMSDPPALIRAIVEKLWPLGDDVTFVPGHGPISTFGQERRTNPCVSDAALQRAPIQRPASGPA